MCSGRGEAALGSMGGRLQEEEEEGGGAALGRMGSWWNDFRTASRNRGGFLENFSADFPEGFPEGCPEGFMRIH